jgi:HK97 family phage major capsid protein
MTRELLEKRANLIKQARELVDKAEKENRDFSAEEKEQYDKLFTEADELRQRAERLEQQAKMEAELLQLANEPVHTRDGKQNTEQPKADFEKRFKAWVTRNYGMLSVEEYRALQADLDVSGGYLRPPEQFVNQLIKAVDDVAYIRQWATVYQVAQAASMGVPTLDADPADSDWTSELATGSEDSTMAFGKRSLTPHPLAKRIKISKKLLMSVPSAEGLVRDRLAYKFGITMEKAFLTGSGHNQPLGVFTASADGISTGRDVSTGNTASAITMDGLKEAKYTLKPAYWPRARWLFHRDVVKMIAKLKDSYGQYLWAESVRVGEPDRLLGLPAFMSEYAPNTFAANLYVGLLGDFSNYWIVDAQGMELQMLVELYAETNQVGLIGRMDSDGQPVLEEAFVRVKLGS